MKKNNSQSLTPSAKAASALSSADASAPRPVAASVPTRDEIIARAQAISGHRRPGNNVASAPVSSNPLPARLLLFAFVLVVVGFDILFGHFLPIWVIGLIQFLMGALLVLEHFRERGDRK
jgi:hypothetical protein